MKRKKAGKVDDTSFVRILLLPIYFVLFFGGTLMGDPVFAADCVDNDGDGYVATCTGCDLPSGKICGDCNDGDPAINPGEAEICGDGIDNDCQAGALEPGDPCLICPTGDADPACNEFQAGICRTGSLFKCSGDLLSLVCPEPDDGYDLPTSEGWSDPASCSDKSDNDCDGLTDNLAGYHDVIIQNDPLIVESVLMTPDPDCAATTEVCDGYDNDWDGIIDNDFNVGQECTSGTGECARTGILVCSGDGLSSVCTADAGSPTAESFGVGNSCADGLDNDCDGLIDIDAECAAPPSYELCDGIDNDLVNGIDDLYPTLGNPCSAGLGECSSAGIIVCAANQLETECSASAGTPVEESLEAMTCEDGLDNDCDGLTDTEDPSCDPAGSDLQVSCALPYTHGKPGNDCGGKHTTEYSVTGGVDPDVHAELLALTIDGELIDLISDVQPGDEAHMASRLYRYDYKLASKTNKKGTRHEIFAPVPMLRVTAQEGDEKAVAYCSNIPYLEVMKPDGEVVSVSSSDTVEVITAIPRVNAQALMILVDGVDILAAMGIDPALQFPGGPFSGTVDINGQMVAVDNLIVDAGDIDTLSSNTLTMTLKNLGGGGHIVYVADESPDTFPPLQLAYDCYDDDLADAGSVAALDVDIISPTDQEIIDPMPPEGVAVSGEVRHGREIAGLKLNGKAVTIPPVNSGPEYQFVAGDGMTTADQYIFFFNENLPEADMGQLMSGTAPLGTVQRGSNKVTADAGDDLGNRAFDTRMFAAGNVLSPDQTAAISAQVEEKISTALSKTYDAVLESTTTEIENAFVAGLEEGAVDRIFQNVCSAASQEFKDRLEENINGTDLGSITVDPDCSCKVTANLVLDSVTLNNDFNCDAAFSDGEINVTFALPDAEILITANNYCKTKGIFGECFTKTVIDVWAKTLINDPVFSFIITEDQIETSTPPTEDMKSFVIGSLRYPGSEESDDLSHDISGIWHNGSDTHCWGAGVCSFFEGVTGFLINTFTFGLVDATDVFDFVTVEFELADFENITGSSEPDPTGIGEMRIDPQTVENYGRASFTPTLTDIDISSLGLTASFSSTFETQTVDPGAEETPGAPLTPAPAPGADLGTSPENAFIVLADDTINQLFASMAESGLKTECTDTGKTINDLLPPDCETLTGETDLATATIQGFCHGIRNADCETLLNEGHPGLQGTEQGVCHGVQGDNCDTIPVVALTGERLACEVTPAISLEPTDPLLFCSRQSIPPQFVLDDDGTTEPLESSLLLNDMTVAMVVDRPANGQLDGELADMPNCFAAEASSLVDCNLFTACLDITLNTQMTLQNKGENPTCPNDPAFVFGVNLPILTSNLEAGVVCGQAATQTDDETVTGQAAADETVEEISENTALFTPPLCAKGLDLGGLFNFQNPKLISVDTGGPDSYGDYFGISGEIQANP
ncbi:MAG: putative metal-binding motif-containing protein [Desulfobulbaceae bacterium]|nr:putative metal-binding motif-containing protein [Desulfobulbaceae bacterium]